MAAIAFSRERVRSVTEIAIFLKYRWFLVEGKKVGHRVIRQQAAQGMRSLGALILSILVILPYCAMPQTANPGIRQITLSSGETVSYETVFSYNKLRRGTEMEWRYTLVIWPKGCFFLADDPAAGHRGVSLKLDGTSGLLVTIISKPGDRKTKSVDHAKMSDCSDSVVFRARIAAPPHQPLGTQTLTGQITWQAENQEGALPPQTTKFELPIEVVEHRDRTAKFNDNYGPHFKATDLWRIPALPFVLLYCGVKGDPDCPD